MAGNRQSSNAGNSSQASGTIQVEVEVARRLNVEGATYEETTDQGNPVIKISGKNIEERNLSEDEISAISRFFVGHQRRSARGGGQGVMDGRGQVQDPSHDARLKGNEEQRPTDPSRDKQAGRASATGNGGKAS